MLRPGWDVKNEWRESFWAFDPDVSWDEMTEEQRAEYYRSGDRGALVVKAGCQPTLIRFRALTTEERAVVRSRAQHAPPREPEETDEAYRKRVSDDGLNRLQLLYYAFRIGVDVPEWTATRPRVREFGTQMLPRDVIDALARTSSGELMIDFYGGLVWAASWLTEADKSAPSNVPQPGGVVGGGSGA